MFQVKLDIVAGFRSQNLSTLLLLAFHMYSELSRATDRMLAGDHYSKFK